MGKELIFKTLRHEETNEIPWVPFAGVHAGKLKGYTAEEILKDSDKLAESLIEVKKLYTPDGMPVLFDLQVEAEILGCDLLWAKDNPPSVKSHPFADTNELPCKCKIPTEESGRLPIILDAMRRVKAEIGEDVALYGLICGPFTLASHLRGSNIFMDMMKNADYVKELVGFCAEVSCKMAEMYIDAGMDVIAVVDPLVSQISPRHIEKMLSDAFKAVFDFIRAKGSYSCFFVCGNATNQIEVMCKMGPDGISVDENVDLVKAKEITDRYNISIGGNIPLTTTMLHGTQEDNMKIVIDLMDSLTHRNLVISPGCDMPYDTPIENTIAASQAVKHPEKARKLLENYQSKVDDIDVTLPDYEHLDKVLIELFLLDPDQCAACTYMLNSVVDAFDEIKDIADYAVYKYTIKEDIARTRKMGIPNLPTMCVNGEIKWVSIIPDREEFISEVRKYAK
ncbi:uroporphyrinogen decarboxylase family protein [Sinanaerobacter chloroacetimidivorans]|jgi:uroporphyrinogen decarboxylase|uniref:Uroporphyrinogen decarboxylase family protein n=1 Tax=Sinanaerobacter chloroacetimidivorans TaxID=2818044 RepID=A0A8J8B2J5_9FIRM|nr:uroporphyrinogen decarboxylase family protein [Sinanaerobacter chloroacetimidivorans]MBR0598811.1 uroporphyrinogen decarboxylase family protein [Sinanaerobacter chloroacetimidivorans]